MQEILFLHTRWRILQFLPVSKKSILFSQLYTRGTDKNLTSTFFKTLVVMDIAIGLHKNATKMMSKVDWLSDVIHVEYFKVKLIKMLAHIDGQEKESILNVRY